MKSPVKIRVAYDPADGTGAGERLWAKPLRSSRHGEGAYELDNHASFCNLVAGDVVRATTQGATTGFPEVTEIVSLVEGFRVDVELPGSVADAGIRSVTVAWQRKGCGWIEGGPGFLCAFWPASFTRTEVEEHATAPLPDGWRMTSVLDATERREDLKSHLRL